MPVALDTSFLVAWEKQGGAAAFLTETGLNGPFYIPVHAAAEYLIGTHPPVRADLRQRAQRLYETHFRGMVDIFTEQDAAALALLSSQLRAQGQQMKLYDAAIAATAISRGDQLLALDSDFDRLADRLIILKP